MLVLRKNITDSDVYHPKTRWYGAQSKHQIYGNNMLIVPVKLVVFLNVTACLITDVFT